MEDNNKKSEPQPHLCHVIKREDFDGYGFNLQAEKGKPGHYIGKIDENSPAEKSGLKEGNRIISVNDSNISNENHNQVVQRIKALSDEVRLIVIEVNKDFETKQKDKKSSTKGGKGLLLSMTVAEMRAKLAAKKKYDPKTDSMDLSKKHDIIQKM